MIIVHNKIYRFFRIQIFKSKIIIAAFNSWTFMLILFRRLVNISELWLGGFWSCYWSRFRLNIDFNLKKVFKKNIKIKFTLSWFSSSLTTIAGNSSILCSFIKYGADCTSFDRIRFSSSIIDTTSSGFFLISRGWGLFSTIFEINVKRKDIFLRCCADKVSASSCFGGLWFSDSDWCLTEALSDSQGANPFQDFDESLSPLTARWLTLLLLYKVHK